MPVILSCLSVLMHANQCSQANTRKNLNEIGLMQGEFQGHENFIRIGKSSSYTISNWKDFTGYAKCNGLCKTDQVL